jgi:hypothetical protein
MVWSGQSKLRLLRFARNDKDRDAGMRLKKILDPRFHGDDKHIGLTMGLICHAGRDPASRYLVGAIRESPLQCTQWQTVDSC